MCRPRRDPRYDVISDAMGMVRCAHDGDDRGLAFLLRSADVTSCAEFLAQLGADLIAQLVYDDSEAADFIARLRDRQLGRW
jgi:hypothetical protein